MLLIKEEIAKQQFEAADSDDVSTDDGDECEDDLVAKGERQAGDGQEKVFTPLVKLRFFYHCCMSCG